MRVNFTRKRGIFTRLRVEFFQHVCVSIRHAIYHCKTLHEKIFSLPFLSLMDNDVFKLQEVFSELVQSNQSMS
jgi:hypothetical protein